MAYLLSNGKVTKDKVTYIKDCIYINMTLQKGDISYSDLGSDELIPVDMIKENLEDHVRAIISDILNRIKLKFKDVKLSIEDIIIVDHSIDNSKLRVKININSDLVIYEISKDQNKLKVIQIDKNIDPSKNETNNLELEKDNYMIKELEKEKNEKIFIVHGRNNELKETIARFLETLELTPIILHEQSNQGKTIIEKLESHSDVGFAVVLMTPDDMGYLVNEESSAKYRARQNVVFELGYFIGKLGRTHVAAIVKGDIEIPTDISGVFYIGVDNNDNWKMMLAKEIKGAGYNINLNKLL